MSSSLDASSIQYLAEEPREETRDAIQEAVREEARDVIQEAPTEISDVTCHPAKAEVASVLFSASATPLPQPCPQPMSQNVSCSVSNRTRTTKREIVESNIKAMLERVNTLEKQWEAEGLRKPVLSKASRKNIANPSQLKSASDSRPTSDPEAGPHQVDSVSKDIPLRAALMSLEGVTSYLEDRLSAVKDSTGANLNTRTSLKESILAGAQVFCRPQVNQEKVLVPEADPKEGAPKGDGLKDGGKSFPSIPSVSSLVSGLAPEKWKQATSKLYRIYRPSVIRAFAEAQLATVNVFSEMCAFDTTRGDCRKLPRVFVQHAPSSVLMRKLAQLRDKSAASIQFAPLELADFVSGQKAHMDIVAKVLTEEWRANLSSNFLHFLSGSAQTKSNGNVHKKNGSMSSKSASVSSKVASGSSKSASVTSKTSRTTDESGGFNCFVSNLHTYAGSDLQRVLKRVTCFMSSQLSAFCLESIAEMESFLEDAHKSTTLPLIAASLSFQKGSDGSISFQLSPSESEVTQAFDSLFHHLVSKFDNIQSVEHEVVPCLALPAVRIPLEPCVKESVQAATKRLARMVRETYVDRFSKLVDEAKHDFAAVSSASGSGPSMTGSTASIGFIAASIDKLRSSNVINPRVRSVGVFQLSTNKFAEAVEKRGFEALSAACVSGPLSQVRNSVDSIEASLQAVEKKLRAKCGDEAEIEAMKKYMSLEIPFIVQTSMTQYQSTKQILLDLSMKTPHVRVPEALIEAAFTIARWPPIVEKLLKDKRVSIQDEQEVFVQRLASERAALGRTVAEWERLMLLEFDSLTDIERASETAAKAQACLDKLNAAKTQLADFARRESIFAHTEKQVEGNQVGEATKEGEAIPAKEGNSLSGNVDSSLSGNMGPSISENVDSSLSAKETRSLAFQAELAVESLIPQMTLISKIWTLAADVQTTIDDWKGELVIKLRVDKVNKIIASLRASLAQVRPNEEQVRPDDGPARATGEQINAQQETIGTEQEAVSLSLAHTVTSRSKTLVDTVDHCAKSLDGFESEFGRLLSLACVDGFSSRHWLEFFEAGTFASDVDYNDLVLGGSLESLSLSGQTDIVRRNWEALERVSRFCQTEQGAGNKRQVST